MKVANPIPILRSFDEHKAREFFIEFLGFKLDWEHRFEPGTPLYMQLSMGDCVIHVSEHYSDCTPGAALRIEVDALDQYHQLLNDKKFKHARPGIVQQPWGRDMGIGDPFGNRLIFCELED